MFLVDGCVFISFFVVGCFVIDSVSNCVVYFKIGGMFVRGCVKVVDD